MKKTNRIAAGVLTAAMALSLTAASLPVNAYDITISDPAPVDEAKHTYKAFQIFAGTVVGTGANAVLTDITWGNDVDSDKLLAELAKDEDFKTCTDLDSTLAFLKDLEFDDETMQKFAKAAANCTKGAGTAEDAAKPDSFKDLDGGYYLITEPVTDALTEADAAYTRYLLRVVDDVNIEVKKDIPSLDKVIDDDPDDEVEGVKANQVSIGDSVPYVLTSEVPDMTGYNKYYFIINDTMSEGLTFNDDIEVKIGTKTLNAGDFTVEAYADPENGFKLVLNDFINYKSQAGDKIVITYSATLNEDANLTDAGNVNTVDLTYSNNPNHEYKGDNEPDDEDKEVVGKTPEIDTKTFTTGLKLKKIDTETEEALKDAVFEIRGEGVKAVLINNQIFKKNASVDPEKAYYQLKNGTFTQRKLEEETADQYASTDTYELVNEVTEDTAADTDAINKTGVSDENGFITFVGLGAGTYTITETKAPEGYNKLSPASFEVTIEAEVSSIDQTCEWSVKKGDETLSADADHLYTFQVKNSQGINLPGTGGTGTVIFYTVGGLLVASAAVLFVTKKRMNNSK